MIAVALLLILAAVCLFVLCVLGGNGDARLHVGPIDFTASAASIFLLGMLTLLLVIVAMSLLRHGTRRAVSRRRDRKKVGVLSDRLDEYKRREHERESDDTAAEGDGEDSRRS